VVNTWFVQNPEPSALSEATDRWEKELNKAAKIIEESSAILLVAGAGIGVDSGLPDYRGPKGLWRAYPMLAEKSMTLESMSDPDWFINDRSSAWGFYAHRAELYNKAQPHKGFLLLKKIVEAKKNNYYVFTSNIDGQFQKAGFDENRIYEAHGTLSYLQCLNENCSLVWKWKEGMLPSVDSELKASGKFPKCPECGTLARPNVSMFGDTNWTWKSSRSKQQKHLFLDWLKESYGPFSQEPKNKKSNQKLATLCILEIGCGVSLHSLRLEVELLCQDKTKTHVKMIRINPSNCNVYQDHNVGIGLGSLDCLELLAKRLQISE